MCGEVEVNIHTLLTWALRGDDWSASHSGRFTPFTEWMGGSVGPNHSGEGSSLGRTRVERRSPLWWPGYPFSWCKRCSILIWIIDFGMVYILDRGRRRRELHLTVSGWGSVPGIIGYFPYFLRKDETYIAMLVCSGLSPLVTFEQDFFPWNCVWTEIWLFSLLRIIWPPYSDTSDTIYALEMLCGNRYS
jgi:hypothetical protein